MNYMFSRTPDNKYIIRRIIPVDESDSSQLERIKKIKENNNYDVILKNNDNYYLLCDEIQDAVIIQEENYENK